MENILSKYELENFSRDIVQFVTWFSLVINRFILGHEATLNMSAWKVLDDKAAFTQLIALKPDEIYPQEIFDIVISDYAKYVRGKSLLEVISRQTAKKGREVLLNYKTFIEIYSANRGPLLSGLYQGILKFYGQPNELARIS